MPFKSEKQRRWMWKNVPELAEKWSNKYGDRPLRRERKPKRKKANK